MIILCKVSGRKAVPEAGISFVRKPFCKIDQLISFN
jgi:hypothetical protein